MRTIVVYDPVHQVQLGTILDGVMEQAKLRRRGAVLLPVGDDNGRRAMDGFFLRHWGEGVLYSGMQGLRGCPMVVDVQPDRPYLFWAMRVVPAGPAPAGTFKLTADPSNPNRLGGGVQMETKPVVLQELGEPDRNGGWCVGGRCTVGVSIPGTLALNVFGIAQDALVQWSAVTQYHEGVGIELREQHHS